MEPKRLPLYLVQSRQAKRLGGHGQSQNTMKGRNFNHGHDKGCVAQRKKQSLSQVLAGSLPDSRLGPATKHFQFFPLQTEASSLLR